MYVCMYVCLLCKGASVMVFKAKHKSSKSVKYAAAVVRGRFVCREATAYNIGNSRLTPFQMCVALWSCRIVRRLMWFDVLKNMLFYTYLRSLK